MSDWQKIETAPSFAAYGCQYVIVVGGKWKEPAAVEADGEWWRAWENPSPPTHWRQLSPIL